MDAAIADRISGYLSVLTVERDADAVAEYYTDDARLLGPGMDLDKAGVVDGLRSLFGAGMRLEIDRRTIELFVHGDAAYELAQAEDTILRPDGSSETLQQRMSIRRKKGPDNQWRFARILLSPQVANDR